MMKIFILFIITFSFGLTERVVSNPSSPPYEAIFNFGDSISDTGNAAASGPPPPPNPNAKSPYGSTFFKGPSGRLSDGRLIIDFIAEAYGLPYLPAYLNLTQGQDISKGVNFAFAGATAIDVEYYKQRKIVTYTDSTLSVQLGWFKKLKPSICKTKQECDSYFKKSLFLVGEIGGNDVVVDPSNITALRERVPQILESITKTTTALIQEGAVELVVPGNFPMGCNSGILNELRSDNKDDYDQLGCLKPYNAFVEYYNEQLKLAIEKLRQNNPQAKIIYADYYGAAKRLFQAPKQYGFGGANEALKACCGTADEPYHLKKGVFCGGPSSTVCSQPSTSINWDGGHYTEAAYKQIAKGLLEGPFTNPPLKSPSSKMA